MIWVRVKVVSCLNVALISGPGAGAGRGGEEERASCRGNQAAGGAAAGMTSVTLHITAAVRATGPLRHHLNIIIYHAWYTDGISAFL